MFTGDGSGGYTGTVKSDEDLAHTGLTVYNITKDEPKGLCPDVHVWSGSAWINLDTNIEAKPDITVTDVDGNTYIARWFGDIPCSKNAKGAYWFLSNLLVTRLSDGSPLPVMHSTSGSTVKNYALIDAGRDGGIPMDRISSQSDLSTGTISYGEDDVSMSVPNITVSRLEYARKFGLYYQWHHANIVCPAGWSLPSMQDWGDLVDNLGGTTDATPGMKANNKYYWDEYQGAV
jgi:hypothetical protein